MEHEHGIGLDMVNGCKWVNKSLPSQSGFPT